MSSDMTYCSSCNQQTVESVSSRRYSHEDLHDAENRAFMTGCAEGERAATQQIVKWLRDNPSLRPTLNNWESDGIHEAIATRIERNDHMTTGEQSHE